MVWRVIVNTTSTKGRIISVNTAVAIVSYIAKRSNPALIHGAVLYSGGNSREAGACNACGNRLAEAVVSVNGGGA